MAESGRVRTIGILVGTAFRADPWKAALAFVLEPVGQLAVPLFGLWLKAIADAAASGSAATAWFGAGGLALSMGALFGVQGIGLRSRITLTERVGFELDRRLSDTSAGIATIEHLERPDYLDRMELLRQQQGVLGQAVGAVVVNIGVALRTILTAVLLARLHPLLLTLPLFGLPSVWFGARAQRRVLSAQEQSAQPLRLGQHLFDLATTPGPAKEVRVFALGDDLLDRFVHARLRAHAIVARARWFGVLLQVAGWASFSIGFAGAIWFVAGRVARGQATPGDILLTVSLAGQVNSNVAGTVQAVIWLQQMLRMASRLTWLLDYAAERRREVNGAARLSSRLQEGIAFENVSFAYPGTDRAVLEDVSLAFPAGSIVALVGENGAGKTTLVKLLLGFYEPTYGRILVDGLDLASVDIEAWRTRVAGAFQDFARLELLARENVGVGDLDHVDDEFVVAGALAKAGAPAMSSELPHGLDTQLGKAWPGGTDLSIGQWQKLALGRGLMREAPLLHVFDEPTASLDAQTEHALFERIADQVRSSRGDGSVTVLISHRFSTVRMADVIVVVDGGRVVDIGSHDELLERKGLYAELYSIQAKAYR